jgi:hypothetical protein
LRQLHSRTTIAARKGREKVRVSLRRTLGRALYTSLIRHQLSSYPYHPSLARVRGAKVIPSRRALRLVIAALSVLTAPATVIHAALGLGEFFRAQAAVVVSIGALKHTIWSAIPATFAAIRRMGCKFIGLQKTIAVGVSLFDLLSRAARCAFLTGRIGASDQFFNRQCTVAVAVRLGKLLSGTDLHRGLYFVAGHSAIRIDVEVFKRWHLHARRVALAGLGRGGHCHTCCDCCHKKCRFHFARPFWVML